MIDYDYNALIEGAAAYDRAAEHASTVVTKLETTKTEAVAGIIGDAGFRLQEKIGENVEELNEAASSMNEAADVLRNLATELERIDREHTSAVAAANAARQETGRLTRLLDTALPDEAVMINGWFDDAAADLYHWRDRASDLENEAKGVSEEAARKLEDLAEWARRASDRAFNRSGIGIVWGFVRGVGTGGKDLVWGTLVFIEDLTIQAIYDFDGWKENWGNTIDGVLFLGELSIRTSPLLGPLSYYILADDGQSFVDYNKETVDMTLGFIHVFVPYTEFSDDPGKVVGQGAFEVAGILSPKTLGKLSKMGKFDEGTKIGKFAGKFEKFDTVTSIEYWNRRLKGQPVDDLLAGSQKSVPEDMFESGGNDVGQSSKVTTGGGEVGPQPSKHAVDSGSPGGDGSGPETKIGESDPPAERSLDHQTGSNQPSSDKPIVAADADPVTPDTPPEAARSPGGGEPPSTSHDAGSGGTAPPPGDDFQLWTEDGLTQDRPEYSNIDVAKNPDVPNFIKGTNQDVSDVRDAGQNLVEHGYPPLHEASNYAPSHDFDEVVQANRKMGLSDGEPRLPFRDAGPTHAVGEVDGRTLSLRSGRAGPALEQTETISELASRYRSGDLSFEEFSSNPAVPKGFAEYIEGLAPERRVDFGKLYSTHAEGHAVEFMKSNDLNEMTIRINNSGGPCDYVCQGNDIYTAQIPEMLDPGMKLTVEWVDEGGFLQSGYFDTVRFHPPKGATK